MTLQRQTSLFTEEKSTSSRVDSLASRTAQQGSDLEKKMTDTSGRRCLEQYGKFSRHGLWAKTFSALLIGMTGWYSKRSVLKWKLKGTRYNRLYFHLQALVPHTKERESFLLPTPQANEGFKASKTMAQDSLTKRLHTNLLPTPTATSDLKGGCTRKNPKRQHDTLAHSIHATHGKAGKTSQLNPLFVEEMLGFPPLWTALPFLDGAENQSKPTETPYNHK